ncbi:MAG: pentapeptide repeat-containing protein, partial [Spirochaetaceae bacterium]|nr:pentapeptide repeat-containing protein [Spirochaetaceae bacterium]
ISAKLINTSFRNCNLKKTIFHNLEQENVSFKFSNIREARFSDNISDIEAKG